MHISNYLFCRRVDGYLFIYFPKETNCFIRCCVPVRVQTVAAGGAAAAGGVAAAGGPAAAGGAAVAGGLLPLEELLPLEDCCRWRTAAAGGGSFEGCFTTLTCIICLD